MRNRKFAIPLSPRLGDVPMGIGTPQLNPEIQAKIGQQLCKIYNEMVNQGVPDRFRDLLDRLEGPGKSSDRERQ
jgi:Anti-sigma factor NepR